MIVLVTRKNDEDPINNEGDRVLTNIPSIIRYMGIFVGCSRAANSAVLGRIWPKFETRPRYYGCPRYLQV